MISSILSRLVILLFGTLYPAYASYKAVKTKDVKEYVKWMMYWIVFALFTCAETFTDVFLSWFPFYYEIKIVLVLWLLSPATKGSSILYRKFVHPMLSKREHEIDDYIAKAKEHGYRQVLDLGQKGVNALMQTAIKSGGGLVNQLRKSYSLSDLTVGLDPDQTDSPEARLPLARKKRVHLHSEMYFSEVDVRADTLEHVQSAEDISSGYSSGEFVYAGQVPKLQAREGLGRTGSVGPARSRSMRMTRSTTVPKKTIPAGTDSNDIVNAEDGNGSYLPEESESSSEPEFHDTLQYKLDLNQSTGQESTQIEKSEIEDTKNSIVTQKIEESKDLQIEDSIHESSFAMNQTRAGKYRKKLAPPPPLPPKDSSTTKESTIKATLVLKPGIVKPIGPPTSNRHSPKTEIFVQSPELRRKRINQSPSRKPKPDSSISRFMMIPKKLGVHFWHSKTDSGLKVPTDKRASWYEVIPASKHLSLLHSKQLSKSDGNFAIRSMAGSPQSSRTALEEAEDSN